MDIKAIETVYKGYRFRSRLEARWAVALTESGVKWEYESEGFDIDGVRVLPDFYLPEKRMYLEVKPQHEVALYTTLPRIYFAGKMGRASCNKIPGACWRSFYPTEYTEFDDAPKAYLFDVSGKQFIYTGPFKGIGDYHGYYHGVTTCGAISEQNILERAIEGVGKCKYFLAYIEDKTAFGTLAEIGYAKSLGKKIIIAFHESLNGQAIDEEDTPNSYFSNDMWFAAAMAEKTMWVANEQEAVEKLLASVPFNAPSKDIKALSQISRYSIVFGDPVDYEVVSRSTMAKDPLATYHLPFIRPEAAMKARQARFEHGEVPV